MFGGYRFNRYVAVEGSYIGWGTTSASGTRSSGAAFDATADQRSYGVAGVTSLELAAGFSVLAKFGYLRTEQQQRSESAGRFVDADTNEWHIGVGARYAFSPQWAVRGEWENTGRLKLQLLSIAAEYRL